MVVNLRNASLDPLLAYIWRSMLTYANEPIRDEKTALLDLFDAIKQVKKSAHYQLYLRDLAAAQQTPPKPATTRKSRKPLTRRKRSRKS